jgi:hypothetical protein
LNIFLLIHLWLLEEPCCFSRGAEETSDLLLLGLLGKENCLDVGQHTSLGDSHTREKLVQFFVIADGELKVTRDDAGLLVVTGSVASELENFSGQVFHNCGKIYRSAGTDALGVVALPQETVDPSDGELKTSPRRAGLGLSLNFASFTASRHDDLIRFSVTNTSASRELLLSIE